MERILVSACLVGQPVRYDGAAKRPQDDTLLRLWQAEGRLVPVCPEVSGGLPVPRPAAEITGGRGGVDVLAGSAQIRTGTGADVTDAFVRGAQLALAAAQRTGARIAVLKEGSPSCGSRRIYDGTFTGRPIPGSGVTTALLAEHGIRVFSEHDLAEAATYLRQLESL